MLLTNGAPPQHNLAVLLAAMTQGIREHESLCALLLPRLALEGAIVAMCAEGLIIDDPGRWAFIETQRKDLVLKEADRSFWFEF